MSDWIEIGILLNPSAQEAATEILYNQDSQGIWLEEDENGIIIRSYFPKDDLNPEKIKLIKNKIEGLAKFGLEPGNVEILTDEVKKEDWATNWKEYFYPEKITDQFVVKPTWREYEPKSEELVIEIDPGMAFGTGTHASTFLAIQALEEFASDRKNMLDVGTGSGILSIAGALLGVPNIIGVDISSVAVKVATENVLLNNAQKKVTIMRSDMVDRIIEKGKTFELITANMLSHLLVQLIPDLPRVIEDNGYFIGSGIDTEHFLEVQQALEKVDFKVERIYRDGEWVALTAKKV